MDTKPDLNAVVNKFNIEKCEKVYNCGNYLEYAIGSIEKRLMLMHKAVDYKFLPFVNRFFSCFEDCKEVKDYFNYLISCFEKDDDKEFKKSLMVLILRIKSDYEAYL